MIDLSNLNESQREAVECVDRPCLVIAGAGSGKTRVLTTKLAYLLDLGLSPQSILALTFTKKAANEMRERVAALVDPSQARRVWMGTFHSVFMRILSCEHEAIGFPSNFTIYDNADSKSLVKSIVGEMGLDEKVYKPSYIFNRISEAKNNLVSPAEYAGLPDAVELDRQHNIAAFHKVYRAYWDRCGKAGAMDFDDLLVYTYLLFSNHEDIRLKYARFFNYVLVDEYQDTNYAQHQIILQLTCEHKMISAVGDDAQSIYSFRGANIDNILNFTENFPDAKVVKLEQNYRSTQNIVSAANSLIAKNRRQIPKQTFSKGEVGTPIKVVKAYSDLEEAAAVAKEILRLHKVEKCRYADCAVLYRTNSQSRLFEELFMKNRIPYRVYGGLAFYQRKEIKDLLSYFKLVCNHNDEEAFRRVVNYPKRGIGDATVGKLAEAARMHDVALWNVAMSPLSYNLALGQAVATKLKAFCEMIVSFRQMADEGNDAYTVALRVLKDSGMKREFQQSNDPEVQSRRENVEELFNAMSKFCEDKRRDTGQVATLYDYITDVSLISDVDTDDADDDKVSLMTVHSAKGLEFDNVCVVGMEEGLFPHVTESEDEREMEEERRLCYVAITRAKTRCFMFYSLSRYRYGKMEFSSPSRFLSDIDARFICQGNIPAVDAQPRKTVSPITPRRLQRVDGEMGVQKEFSAEYGVGVGTRIKHERFGLGTVRTVEGDAENTKALIEFDNAGVGKKQLLLKYAKFEIVG